MKDKVGVPPCIVTSPPIVVIPAIATLPFCWNVTPLPTLISPTEFIWSLVALLVESLNDNNPPFAWILKSLSLSVSVKTKAGAEFEIVIFPAIPSAPPMVVMPAIDTPPCFWIVTPVPTRIPSAVVSTAFYVMMIQLYSSTTNNFNPIFTIIRLQFNVILCSY